MKVKLFFLFVLIFVFLNTGAYAQLGKFKEDVEKAEAKKIEKEKEEKEKEEEKKKNTSSDSSSSSSGLFDFFFSLWFITNGGVTYGEYPHHSKKFVYMGLPELYNVPEQGSGTQQKKKNHWFSTEIQGFYMSNLGYGPWAVFQGNIFRFFGPYLEAAMVLDGEDYLGMFRLGGTLSLLQTNPFCLSVYGEWLAWRGIMERSGGAIGLKMRSYLIKYIVLDARLGTQIFENFFINEAELKIGIMLKRWEISAGWRFWSMFAGENELIERYNGPFMGVGIYF